MTPPLRVLGALVLVACSPSDVLTVPAPAGQLPSSTFAGRSGAESLLESAMFDVFDGLDYFNSDNPDYGTQTYNGLIFYSGLLTDEFRWANTSAHSFDGVNIDARYTVAIPNVATEWGDMPLQTLLQGRIALLLARPMLQQYEPSNRRSLTGEAYAMLGYVDTFLAEDYCAGVPLSAVLPGGGVQYGQPLSTDSLLGVAEQEFDSAFAYAAGVDSIAYLASVGLGRARVDRANYAGAAAAVANVPTSYVYNAQLQANAANPPYAGNQYEAALTIGPMWWNVSNREGQNGLDFVSAADPRLVIDSALVVGGQPQTTADGTTFYYPIKFGTVTATTIPLATGAEARLIEAEAALQGGQSGTWAAKLNALRAAAPGTYLLLTSGVSPLPPDSTTGASRDEQVDVMFREREFWLFGTGTRLGDLRRLVRQYGRNASTVYPVGPYPLASVFPFPTYGTDIDFPLPTPLSGTTSSNPNVHGCLSNAA
jgi:starch-binding outer membrane protein, SusD/RagB family